MTHETDDLYVRERLVRDWLQRRGYTAELADVGGGLQRLEITGATVTIYCGDEDNDWPWEILDAEGETVADGIVSGRGAPENIGTHLLNDVIAPRHADFLGGAI